MHILYHRPTIGNERILVDWAKENGCFAVQAPSMSDRQFPKTWNKLPASGGAVMIEYPLHDRTDLSTVTDFISHVRQYPGKWYYAPRPNDYLAVERAVFVGMTAIEPLNAGVEDFIKKTLVRLISSTIIPLMVRQFLMRTAVKLYRWLKKVRFAGNGYPVCAEQKVQDSSPAVPRNIALLGSGWQGWQAPKPALRRDLIDRLSHFFPVPRNIHVILLNRCNLKCIMCPYHSPVYRKHHTSRYFAETHVMTEEILERIVKYAAKNSVSLQFGQIEEPLMHPKVFDFIERAKRAGVPHVHMTTNGTLLNHSAAERLAKSGIDSLMFSIDAATPETYLRIRGKDLHETEEHIRFFLSTARGKRINTSVSFILQPVGQKEREQFLEKWRKLGVNSVTYYVLTEHDTKDGSMIRTHEMYQKGKRYPCASPWVQSVVFPDGEVSLCCKSMTDVGWRGVVSLGNLRSSTFEQIWDGVPYRDARAELLENVFKDYQLCANCAIWSATTYLTEETTEYIRSFNETAETIVFKETK